MENTYACEHTNIVLICPPFHHSMDSRYDQSATWRTEVKVVRVPTTMIKPMVTRRLRVPSWSLHADNWKYTCALLILGLPECFSRHDKRCFLFILKAILDVGFVPGILAHLKVALFMRVFQHMIPQTATLQ
jgi:hypothetical protein